MLPTLDLTYGVYFIWQFFGFLVIKEAHGFFIAFFIQILPESSKVDDLQKIKLFSFKYISSVSIEQFKKRKSLDETALKQKNNHLVYCSAKTQLIFIGYLQCCHTFSILLS